MKERQKSINLVNVGVLKGTLSPKAIKRRATLDDTFQKYFQESQLFQASTQPQGPSNTKKHQKETISCL